MKAPAAALLTADKLSNDKPKYRVSQRESDGVAGLWIYREGDDKPCVAIYLTEAQGPVVGVYSRNINQNALAAAIAADPLTGEGQIQLLDKDGEAVIVTATQLHELLALLLPKE